MTTVNVEYWHMALAKSELRVANVLKRGKSEAMSRLNKARAAYRRALYGPAERYEDAIPIEINGIPCTFHVSLYRSPIEARIWNVHPDFAHPGEPAVIDGIICDQKGYPAKWLERMSEWEDVERQVMEWKGDYKHRDIF